ncbi:MAG: hypothetical protein R3E36_12695 [Nitrosomonas sp.]|nr:hypothetical protein [Nitrosomonas sp.]
MLQIHYYFRLLVATLPVQSLHIPMVKKTWPNRKNVEKERLIQSILRLAAKN